MSKEKKKVEEQGESLSLKPLNNVSYYKELRCQIKPLIEFFAQLKDSEFDMVLFDVDTDHNDGDLYNIKITPYCVREETDEECQKRLEREEMAMQKIQERSPRDLYREYVRLKKLFENKQDND